jgi:hypothetical protein
MDEIEIAIEQIEELEEVVQQRDTGNNEFKAVHFIRDSISDNKTFIKKLMQIGPPHNRPLCTTVLSEGAPIGTYGSINCSTKKPPIAGVVFDEKVCVAGFFPTDIYSLRFKFDSTQPITPEQMNKLEEWQRSCDPPPKRPRDGYLRHGMKLTRTAALEKLSEIVYRRSHPAQDHSSTMYKSIDNKEIYTGIVGKYSTDPRNFKVLGNNVPPDTIRHNEAFLINCGLVDIKGVVVMEEDFYRKR